MTPLRDPHRTVLVTGAAGFLGRALAERLLAQGTHVVGVDVAPGAARNVEWITASSGDCAKFAACLRECAAVVHMAWSSYPGSAEEGIVDDLSSNVVSTIRLFQAAKAAGVPHFMFISSGGTVYGRPDAHPTTELAELRPIGAHGAAKASAELYLRAQSHEGPTRVSILRLANAYGPGQLPWRGQGAIPTAIACALTGQGFTMWGDGSVVRDYLYVDDAVDAMALVLARRAGGVMNVGSGVGLSLRSMVSVVEEALQRRVLIEHAPVRSFDIPVSILDATRLRSEVGWEPSVSLREGIVRSAQWLESNAELWRPDPLLAAQA